MEKNSHIKKARINSHWVIETKFIPNTRQENILLRQDLLKTVYQSSITFPVTLISAPAGYGKTTLSSYLFSMKEDLSVAWLSLDSSDNDPTRFLVNLITSFHRVDQRLATNALNAIKMSLNPAAEMNRIIGVLINDLKLSDLSPIILILDDLHAISQPKIIQLLDYLIEYIPESLHLVISTRHDPHLALSRLRARRQLAEFKTPQLRFSFNEIQAFFNEQNGFSLSTKSLSLLETHTEGWAAGINIIMASLENIPTREQRDSFISQLPVSSRFVFDYLAEEVLNHQEPRIRKFLLETSILSELSPARCQSVTGENNAGDILERLYRQNLFLVSIDEFNHLYRYHELFAKFLQKKLEQEYGQDHIKELHGLVAQSIKGSSQSIPHYLQAELWEDAAAAIVLIGRQMMYKGLFETIKSWGEELPGRVVEGNPHITYLLSFCAFQQGEFGRAQSFVDQSIEGFKLMNEKEFVGEAMLLAGSIASGLHDVHRAKDLMDEALSYPISPHLKISGHINRAWVSVYSGNWMQVEDDVDIAIQLALQLEDPDAFNMLAPHLTAVLLFIPNGIKRLKEYCTQVLAWFGDTSAPAVMGALTLLSTIHLFQCKKNESFQLLERANTMRQKLGSFVWLDMNLDMMFLSHCQIFSDFVAFEKYWGEQLSKYEIVSGLREYLCVFLFTKGRVLLLQGRMAEANEIYERMKGLDKPEDLPENTLSRALMGAMIAISEERFQLAEGILREVASMQRQAPYSILFGDARVLLSIIYHRWNQNEKAFSELKPVLMEYERLGVQGLLALEAENLVPLIRWADEQKSQPLLTDFLKILDDQYSDRPIIVPSTGEVLTSREMEVLRLIATGYSNRDIANQLVISMPTVKSHVTSILRKLGVKSRTQAVIIARESLIL